MLGGTSGNAYAPLASVTSAAGAGVTPSAANTRAGPPASPPLPAPVTSVSCTRTFATGSPVRASNTTPAGAIHTSASVRVAPQPRSVARTASLRVTSTTPVRVAANVPVASNVGTFGSMRNRPVEGPVSAAR